MTDCVISRACQLDHSPVVDTTVDTFVEAQSGISKNGLLISPLPISHQNSNLSSYMLLVEVKKTNYGSKLLLDVYSAGGEIAIPYNLFGLSVSWVDGSYDEFFRDWTYGCQFPGVTVFPDEKFLDEISLPNRNNETIRIRLWGEQS